MLIVLENIIATISGHFARVSGDILAGGAGG